MHNFKTSPTKIIILISYRMKGYWWEGLKQGRYTNNSAVKRQSTPSPCYHNLKDLFERVQVSDAINT